MALTDNLISFWELEEASGTRADSTATANTLTDNATVTQNTGKVGSCGQFTAANTEYLSHTSNASLQSGDIDFSWSFWVYLDSISDQVFVSKDDSGSGQREYFFYMNSSGALQLGVCRATDSAKTATWGSNFSTATWYHVIGWHDATADTVNITINDGTPVSTATTGALQAASTADFQIGHDKGFGLPTNGRIDQVGYWKRVLTSGERTQLYNSGAGLSYTDMTSAAGGQPTRQRFGGVPFMGYNKSQGRTW